MDILPSSNRKGKNIIELKVRTKSKKKKKKNREGGFATLKKKILAKLK